jgi:hypothetical protein
METQQIQFELEGTKPLLMDRNAGGEAPKNAKDDWYKKEAENKVYVDNKGLYIPGEALKAVIRECAATRAKRGQAMMEKRRIRAGLFVDEKLYLGKKTYDIMHPEWVTRGKGDKVTRVKTFRPLINSGWKVKGRITNFCAELRVNNIKEWLQEGGFLFGLLGHRPEYGQFIVKKFVVV